MKLVIVPSPQIGAITFKRRKFQSIDTRKEIETVLEPICQDLDMTKVGNIKAGIDHRDLD
jgi:hypothetical protein